jgi:hypothetical protein
MRQTARERLAVWKVTDRPMVDELLRLFAARFFDLLRLIFSGLRHKHQDFAPLFLGRLLAPSLSLACLGVIGFRLLF